MVYLPGVAANSQNSVFPEERSLTNVKLDINNKKEKEGTHILSLRKDHMLTQMKSQTKQWMEVMKSRTEPVVFHSKMKKETQLRRTGMRNI